MKVAFIGNTCNNHYDIIKQLRRIDVDAHLFLPYAHQFTEQTLPESQDQEIKGNYPGWIHLMQKTSKIYPLGYIAGKDKAKLKKFDTIITHGEYANFLPKEIPFIIYPHGADLYLYPFMKFKHPIFFNLLPMPKYWFVRNNFINGYRKAAAIISGFFAYHYQAAFRLLYADKMIAPIPISIDTSKFICSYKGTSFFQDLFPDFSFYVFHPARLMWSEETLKQGEFIKGNDIIIKGFAKFAKSHNDSVLILVRKKSHDYNKTLDLIRSLEMENNIKWVDPVPRYKMIEYYHSADLLIESVGGGGYGSIVVEAMSCGLPVMMEFDEERWTKIIGEKPPLIAIKNINDIELKLSQCYKKNEYLKKISRDQRNYVERYHSTEATANQIKSLLNSIKLKTNFKFLTQDVYV